METFLTSNTFFGRKAALQFPKRNKYANIIEMNKAMIDKWNSIVTDDDIVYHLGYFAHDPFTTNEVLEYLQGNMVFFNNNTDVTVKEILHLFDGIDFIDCQIHELLEKKSILCYNPLDLWTDDLYHFYGDDRIANNLEISPNRMCVSFDTWDKPINIDSCIDFINQFKK